MKRDFWVNQGLFQAAWPACVIGAAYGTVWFGLIVVGAMLAWQLRDERRHPTDFRLLLICLMIGFILDTLLVQFGFLVYATPWPSAGFAPLWIMLLWVALALVINHSMSAFKDRLWLLAILGGVGSPMSYYAGSRFGAVEWAAPAWQVAAATGLSWAALLPFLFWYARRAHERMESETKSQGTVSQ